MSNSIASIN